MSICVSMRNKSSRGEEEVVSFPSRSRDGDIKYSKNDLYATSGSGHWSLNKSRTTNNLK
jgi:hypothetical protein